MRVSDRLPRQLQTDHSRYLRILLSDERVLGGGGGEGGGRGSESEWKRERRGEEGGGNEGKRERERGRKKLALQRLSCQAPGVIGSVLGLVGPVSVYCDWVKWKVGSATCIIFQKRHWCEKSFQKKKAILLICDLLPQNDR